MNVCREPANWAGRSWQATHQAAMSSIASALLATSLSGRLMASLGAKSVMVIGLLLSALGCFGVVIVETQTSYVLLACLLFVLGGGLALVLPAMTEAAISHAPKAQSGIASGMLNVSRQVGGVFGVAILGTLVGNQQTFLSGMHLAFVIAGRKKTFEKPCYYRTKRERKHSWTQRRKLRKLYTPISRP